MLWRTPSARLSPRGATVEFARDPELGRYGGIEDRRAKERGRDVTIEFVETYGGDQLEALAGALLERETLESADIAGILAGARFKRAEGSGATGGRSRGAPLRGSRRPTALSRGARPSACRS
jgi:hypothetical protein